MSEASANLVKNLLEWGEENKKAMAKGGILDTVAQVNRQVRGLPKGDPLPHSVCDAFTQAYSQCNSFFINQQRVCDACLQAVGVLLDAQERSSEAVQKEIPSGRPAQRKAAAKAEGAVALQAAHLNPAEIDLEPGDSQRMSTRGRPAKRPRTEGLAVVEPDPETGHLPPRCGAVPNADDAVLGRQTKVVASVRTRRGGESNWILAYTSNYDASRNRYAVEDGDPSSDGRHAQRYDVSAKDVIPLPTSRPKAWVPEAEHPKGSEVLAMFPETTTFYPARVIQVPRRRRDDEYLLEFRDDLDDDGNRIHRTVRLDFVVARR